ncbi:rna-directed dna polymerase from mobile element jockey- hypothetical protein [Limosa lapponica baueri]|uniref:Reverse transcriptase domain-containing protein n=1 Tax=Limosa lapponica baueri TaxID=1758121 RepID=A0A2I0TII0_LIMLA|nr:rna-directed dna polymerase from mobile element jockey- hypothetical protein [Limosa lapponica baueri]
MKVFSILPSNHVSNEESLFLRQLPKLVIGFIAIDAFSSNYAKNPFNVELHDTKFLSLYVDAEQMPGKPLQPDFENGFCRTSMPVLNYNREQGKVQGVAEDWRKANVTPVFKKGKKEDPGNYRLVSLTSIPGKMMERLILGIISKHMEEKKAIRSSQHGFTKGK